MKRTLSLLLTAVLIIAAFASCGSYTDPTASIEVKTSTDKYRNYYEIFVGSFCDSDGDGTGDIPGIISKLDYLNDGDPETDSDLGIDGIWLTPIMPSQSYHKYDVSDYFGVDEAFGTLDDFDKLIKECHKRGIKLIIDMVLNHCSNVNPLFQSACEQALKGDLDHDAQYFEIAHYDDDPGTAYTSIGKGYYYESNFSPHMPEWNLDKKCTRDYFLKIADFWLNDHDVDGFRLDATLYYDGKHTDGTAFLKWYYSAVQKLKKDVYMVGENWTGNAEIKDRYKAGLDSLFAFGFAGTGGGFVNAVRMHNRGTLVSSVQKYEEGTKKNQPSAINAYFLSNHDQVRSGNYLKGMGLSGTKMGAAMYMLVPGNSFIYYGEEIGLTQDAQAEGDEPKREPMIWDSENLPEITVNNMLTADAEHAPYGGVKQQEDDENSLLSFYKRVIKVKNQNPAIARGTITEEIEFDNQSLCGYIVEYEGEKIAIVHNLSNEETLSAQSDKLSGAELRADLVASNGDSEEEKPDEHISFSGDTVNLPPYSTAVLKLA